MTAAPTQGWEDSQDDVVISIDRSGAITHYVFPQLLIVISLEKGCYYRQAEAL